MLAFKLHVPSINKKEIGVVIENKQLDYQTHQLVIKLDGLREIPNADDFYLISFRGGHGLHNQYHQLKVSSMPDENNLLSFTVKSSSGLDKDLGAILPGTKVKVKGPFNDSVKQAG